MSVTFGLLQIYCRHTHVIVIAARNNALKDDNLQEKLYRFSVKNWLTILRWVVGFKCFNETH